MRRARPSMEAARPRPAHIIMVCVAHWLTVVWLCLRLRRSWWSPMRQLFPSSTPHPPLPHRRAKEGVHGPSGLAHPSRFARRCAVQTHGIADNTPEKKGDLFAMSVLISRRQRGAQTRQYLVERGTWARRLIGLNRRRDRVLGAFQLSRQSGNRIVRR